MDMLTHGTLHQIMKQLERITNALDRNTPISKLPRDAALRLTEDMRKYDVERKIKKILGAKCEATS